MKEINLDEHIKRRFRIINYFLSNGAEEEFLTIERELVTLLRELKQRRRADEESPEHNAD